MKHAVIVCLALPVLFHHAAAAAGQSPLTCTYFDGRELTIGPPKKPGILPPIEADYPAKMMRFSRTAGNLLVVAMDEAERSRIRAVISAQRRQAKAPYKGQILVDMGGQQIQLYNGPVACTAGS